MLYNISASKVKIMNDDTAITSALNHINTHGYKEKDKAYISQKDLNLWNDQNSPYTLKRGEVVTKRVLYSSPSFNGPSYGYASSTEPINNIYMLKKNMPIVNFVLKNKEFVVVVGGGVKNDRGGSNKKSKHVKSKRRTKKSKRSKRKTTRKYRMK